MIEITTFKSNNVWICEISEPGYCCFAEGKLLLQAQENILRVIKERGWNAQNFTFRVSEEQPAEQPANNPQCMDPQSAEEYQLQMIMKCLSKMQVFVRPDTHSQRGYLVDMELDGAVNALKMFQALLINCNSLMLVQQFVKFIEEIEIKYHAIGQANSGNVLAENRDRLRFIDWLFNYLEDKKQQKNQAIAELNANINLLEEQLNQPDANPENQN